MKINKKFLEAYESSKLVHYKDVGEAGLKTVAYDDLGKEVIPGVLKMSMHKDGRLMQVYTENGNHVGVIAGTRLGKTTSYVIPTIISFARQKVKKSMIISDPKGEIYRYTAETLRQEGYDVKLLNFRNYLHSECWNPLTPVFRAYRKAQSVGDDVEIVVADDGRFLSKYKGVVYESQAELDADIENEKMILEAEVGNAVDNIATLIVDTQDVKDPYWEDSARDLLKAFLWAMLEDSDLPDDDKNKITEDTFSFSTILKIISYFDDRDTRNYNDRGYFTDREMTSRAKQIAQPVLTGNAGTTRKCILAMFFTKISMFNESAMRLVTSCNSFEMSELTGKPVAFFIDYKDEIKAHYKIISLFVKDAYKYLIETANDTPDGKLPVPFYFILDEFGNFPKMVDFETTISACAGRQIFFILIIQSYAQLNNVYGDNVAEIIKDNLNVHVFFGSNNFRTLKEFSEECGEYARVSPVSALNGSERTMDNYQIETVPLVTKSRLAHFEPGECVITEANCGYVMLSKLERYYLCKEFSELPQVSEKDYIPPINPLAKKYIYTYTPTSSSFFD